MPTLLCFVFCFALPTPALAEWKNREERVTRRLQSLLPNGFVVDYLKIDRSGITAVFAPPAEWLKKAAVEYPDAELAGRIKIVVDKAGFHSPSAPLFEDVLSDTHEAIMENLVEIRETAGRVGLKDAAQAILAILKGTAIGMAWLGVCLYYLAIAIILSAPVAYVILGLVAVSGAFATGAMPALGTIPVIAFIGAAFYSKWFVAKVRDVYFS